MRGRALSFEALGRLPFVVDALQVLVLKRLYIFSLEHLLSLFLSCQVVKVAIKTLSQSFGNLFILGIVSDELRG